MRGATTQDGSFWWSWTQTPKVESDDVALDKVRSELDRRSSFTQIASGAISFRINLSSKIDLNLVSNGLPVALASMSLSLRAEFRTSQAKAIFNIDELFVLMAH